MADNKVRHTPTERVAEWAASTDDLAIDGEGRLVVSGEPPLTIEIAADDERLTLTHHAGVTPEGYRTPTRGNPVRVEMSDATGALSLSTSVFLDGLNRQSFSTAVNALVSAVDAMVVPNAPDLPTETTAERSVLDEPEPTREMPAVWVPTHAVPAGGTRAWANPDPSQEPVATLEARVRLSIAERRGDWSRVIGSNGWTGWVDARVLEPLTSETAAEPNAAFRFRPLPAIGAVAVGLSALLPWVNGLSNTFDISARFLWDYNGAGAPDLGWVLIGLAGVILVLAAAKGSAPLVTLAGLAAIAIAVLFAVQLYRGVTDSGGAFSDIMDIAKFSPLLTVAGGVLTIVGARK